MPISHEYMDDHEDIFGQDVRDSSYLQIVSSDDEDVDSSVSPVKSKAKHGLKNKAASKRTNYYDKMFDRQFRLGKSVESAATADTQNIIDELNKIFEKSELSDEKEDEKLEENVFEMGKNILNKFKSGFSAIHEQLFTQRQEQENTPTRRKRTRNTPRVNYRLPLEFEGICSSASSEARSSNDEEYDPAPEPKKKPKKTKKRTQNEIRHYRKSCINEELGTERETGELEHFQKFDNFGFAQGGTHEDPEGGKIEDFQDRPESYTQPDMAENTFGDMFCLKFVVIDQNRNQINDSRLDSVFIKTTETLGNIAKKIGEMYNLGQEFHTGIKIIIDGDQQDHSLQIGNPLLGVEDKMQIDIKFPPKDGPGVKAVEMPVERPQTKPKPPKTGGRSRRRPTRTNASEVVEID